MLGVLLDGPAKTVMNALDISLLPTMTEPWKSRTLAEFWAQRWNQAAGNALRSTVYQPVLSLSHSSSSSSSTKRRRRSTSTRRNTLQQHRFIATCMTFFISGAVHEAIHYMVMNSCTPQYKWLLFSKYRPLCCIWNDISILLEILIIMW